MAKIKPRQRRRARSQAGQRIAARRLSQSPNAIRLRRLRKAAVKRGLCLVCRLRYPKAGQKICLHCYALKNERAAGYVAQGRCPCGRPRAPDKMRCVACGAAVERSRAKREIKLRALKRCVKCGHGWPIGNNKTCPSCIANINAYGTLRAMVNVATGHCACGRDKPKASVKCTTCSFRRVFQKIRTRVAVRAAR